MGEQVVDWRRWVAAAVGPGARVVGARRLHGGITSVVHAVDVVDPRAGRHRLVLRRYPPGGVVDDEPGIVAAEVAALEALAAARVAGTPRLLAHDLDGRSAGSPAVLSTRLPGRPVVAPADPLRWATALAGVVVRHLDAMRAIDVASLRRFEPWYPVGAADPVPPPAWVRDPDRWRARFAAVGGDLPASGAPWQAIHRDLNPGNVLLSRGRASGLVDWVHLCTGPLEEDIGRCRLNVWLLAGRAAAARFSAEIERSGLPYDPVWDLAVLADQAPHLDGVLAANRLGARLTPAVVHRRAEAIARG